MYFTLVSSERPRRHMSKLIASDSRCSKLGLTILFLFQVGRGLAILRPRAALKVLGGVLAVGGQHADILKMFFSTRQELAAAFSPIFRLSS